MMRLARYYESFLTGIPAVIRQILWGITALLTFQPALAADPPWEWVNPLPQGQDLISIATGEGVIVTVGGDGTILVSSDGVEWDVRAATTEYFLSDVAYGNGRFVAVGGNVGPEMSPGLGVYLKSADGWHWEERHRTGGFTPEAVNWNGSQFVAVGRAGWVVVSPDGETWSDHQLAVMEWDMADLVWDGSRYLAVGNENWFEGRPSKFTSDDGLSWDQAPLEYECAPSAVTWAEGRYVVVGGIWPGQPCVLTSENGQDWVRSSLDSTSLLRDVTYANGGFLAVGVNGLVASSPDGYAWSAHEEPTGDNLFGLTWAGDRFLTVGEDGLLLSSPDGFVWNELSSRMLGFSHLVEIREVVKGNGTFVAVGSYGVIVTSPDGVVWTQQPSPAPGNLHSVTWAKAEFWAVSNYGIIRSADGFHWDLALFDDEIQVQDVASGAGLLVAVGRAFTTSSSQTLVATSSDGSDWSYHWLESEGPLRAVEWTGSRFVAVGAFGLQYESADGITWEGEALDEATLLKDLAWNGDRLVAIGGVSGVGSLVMTSSGDLEWEVVTPPEGVGFRFDDVLWTGDRFVAVGKGIGDSVVVSPDGISWSSEATTTGLRMIAVGGDEHTIFGFGRGDKIIRRKKSFSYTPPPPPRRAGARISPVPVQKVIAKPVTP